MGSAKKSPARVYIEDLVRQYPVTASKTLASMARRDEPKLFASVEYARGIVRTVRGNRGALQRAWSDKSLQRENTQTGANWQSFMPQPRARKPWAPLIIDGPFRALVAGDFHVPFHDLNAVMPTIDQGIKDKCDLVLLNGDIIDNHAISRWETDPRERDFAAELEATRGLLKAIRKAFPKARIIYKWGNHDERWDAYMRYKAPELLDVPEFKLEQILRLDDLKIESVKDCRPIHLGKLPVIHGHEYKNGISAPVNAARGLYLKAKVHAMCNHVHTTSNHSESDMHGHVITTFSVACLCDLRPEYARMNKWNHGFAIVDVDPSGAFDVNNYRIVGGKVYR